MDAELPKSVLLHENNKFTFFNFYLLLGKFPSFHENKKTNENKEKQKKTNGSKDVQRDAPSCNSLKSTLSKSDFDLAVIILRRVSLDNKTWFLSELTHFWPMLPFSTSQKHQKANRKLMVFSGGRSIKWKHWPEIAFNAIIKNKEIYDKINQYGFLRRLKLNRKRCFHSN